jgi:signal recognition particle subunit SEC65
MAKANTRARSSITGRYVKKEYAKKHPKTTEIEKVKRKK